MVQKRSRPKKNSDEVNIPALLAGLALLGLSVYALSKDPQVTAWSATPVMLIGLLMVVKS